MAIGLRGRDRVFRDDDRRLDQAPVLANDLDRDGLPTGAVLRASGRPSSPTTGTPLISTIRSPLTSFPSAAGVPARTPPTWLGTLAESRIAEEAVFDLLPLLQRLDRLAAEGVHRDRVAGLGVEPRGAGRGGGDADQLPLEVDHGAAAHPQVELGVELEERRPGSGSARLSPAVVALSGSIRLAVFERMPQLAEARPSFAGVERVAQRQQEAPGRSFEASPIAIGLRVGGPGRTRGGRSPPGRSSGRPR